MCNKEYGFSQREVWPLFPTNFYSNNSLSDGSIFVIHGGLLSYT